MGLGLTGRVAIVAAASKGLGRAAAEELAAKASTWPFAPHGEHARETAAHIQKMRPRSLPFKDWM